MPFDVRAEVLDNRALSPDYNVLALAAPEVAGAASPGQFVMIKAGRGHDPLLRRPFSVFEVLRDARGVVSGLSLWNKRVGPSTALVYAAKRGDRVDCLGPLGRPFSIVDRPSDAWMVAGGVGLAPFAALAEALRGRGISSTLFYGARSAGELFYLQLFRDLGVELLLTTEDGSAGERGRIVAPLERRLAARADDAPVMVYACGPEGMLAATAFHDYGVLWQPDRITYFIDRRPVSEIKVPVGFHEPMYMIVNLAMGSKNFEGVGFVDGQSPATVAFEIDRISAYQIDER